MKRTTNRSKTRQYLDYYIGKELANGQPRGFAIRVQGKLAEHGMLIKRAAIYTRAKDIMSPTGLLTPAADVDGTPSGREGKDLNYAGVWTLADILPKKHYIGLAANQLDLIMDRCDTSIICEWKQARFDELRQLANVLQDPSRHPRNRWSQLICSNIWYVLDQSTEEFNLFDLDLMCVPPPVEELATWVQFIYKAAMPGLVVVNFTCCTARGTTLELYEASTKKFISFLEREGFLTIGHSRFSYKDRQMPMGAEKLLLVKQ